MLRKTHRIPVAAEGSLAGLDTAAAVGSLAAGAGLAGMPPGSGRTGRYLQGVTGVRDGGQ